MTRLEGWDRGLFRAGDRVCCALSGGADSVALLLALREANMAKESLGVVLSAVHVHHGLRGAEADADEAFVRELCGRLAVPLTVERVDTAGRQAAEGEGLEEAARELRYAVFARLLAEGSAEVIATAHTLDDQAETLIMKLLRGAWTEGLGAISPVIEVSEAARQTGRARWSGAAGQVGGGRIVRPLLDVRRAAVEAFLREREQGWCDDSSNRDLRLTRNRVRQELMPLLRSFNPAIDASLARTTNIAREEESYWQSEVARLLPGLLLPGKPVRGGGRAVSTALGERSVAMEIDRLGGLAPALRRRVLRAAARELGCRISSEETSKLLWLGGWERAEEARAGARIGTRIGTRLELGRGLRAERSARELRLSRNATIPLKM